MGEPQCFWSPQKRVNLIIRALDSGGMVWEGRMVYAILESALQALDDALAAWMKENVEHE